NGAGPGGVVLAMPVYRARDPAGAGAACPQLVGQVVVALALDRLFGHSFSDLRAARADLYLLDADAPPGARLLGIYPGNRQADGPQAPFVPLREEALEGAEGAVVRPLEVGGRNWRMVLVPPAPALFMPGDGAAWIALVLGLLITVLVTGYLHREERAMAMLQTEARARAAMARMLRESEERFRLALRHSRVSVFSQDRELRYIWMYNPQVPIPAERFIGRTHAELYGPDDAAKLDGLKRRVLETGRGIRQEVYLTVAGRPAVDDLVVEPLRDDGGEIVGVICAAIDITESTQIKEALAEAHAEAERANRAKTRFLAAASHDLRQPFQAMSLFHHILVSRLEEPKQLDIARKLGEALAAGNALLGALLDASALEAGNVQPRIVEFAFQEVAGRLANEIADQAAGNGLEFRMVATSAVVRSDPVLLERILRNLLVNALRYTPSGGILLGCRRRGERLSIEVWDTGPGIAEDQLHRIFEEFYRCGAEQQDGARGLGLGLSTVRRMAQMLDHSVTVRSRVGRGTVFAVTVPLVGSARGDGCLPAAASA
ncbi:MAG TPA: ATP-binding protein, partial [Azospirillum sp.]